MPLMEFASLIGGRFCGDPGPNGAGKTTLHLALPRLVWLRFVNADVLAGELALEPYEAARLAGALIRQQRPECPVSSGCRFSIMGNSVICGSRSRNGFDQSFLEDQEQLVASQWIVPDLLDDGVQIRQSAHGASERGGKLLIHEMTP